MGLTILGVFCLLWAVATAIIAVVKPAAIWESGKISGFVKLLGNGGTTVLLVVLAIGMGALGAWLTFFN